MKNGKIEGKLIVIGDVHFGVKRFDMKFLRNTLDFFTEQLFPYMKENGINTIFQLGDLFDNRTTTDINFLHELRIGFFEEIKKNGFILHTLIGNHDIFFRESREVTLVNFFRDLYPDNFIVYEDRTEVEINNMRTYIVPWITKSESFSKAEIEEFHNVLGHFEIRDFHMVKGAVDKSSELDEGFFLDNTNIKNVFSGHYHIKNTTRDIKYLGTPIWINWNDFNEEKGFYVWDEFDSLVFIPNKISKKFIKVKYNDSYEKNIEVEGYSEYPIFLSEDEFKDLLPSLERHELKFFINKSSDRHFDEILYSMSEINIKPTVIDNQEISKIIGTDYFTECIVNNINLEDTRQLIVKAVTENREDLTPLVIDIFNEIDSEKNKEV